MPCALRGVQRLGPSSQSRYARGRDRTGRRGDRPMRRRELLLTATALMAAPGGLRAQQKPMPVIGFLSSEWAGMLAPRLAAFRQGLSETGYVEGQNVVIEPRWAEGHF